MKTVCKFNEEKHEYSINGFRVPSVTEVIGNVFGKPDYANEWHMQRGRAVHKCIEYLVKGKLNWASVDGRIVGRVKAFEKFYIENKFQAVHSELCLFSKKQRFGGTLDLILDSDQIVLCDIKSTIEPTVDIQLGGYCLLLKENGIKPLPTIGAAVQLRDDGYSVRWVKSLSGASKLFLSALQISNFKQSNNLK